MPRLPLHVRLANWLSDRWEALLDFREQWAERTGAIIERTLDGFLGVFDSFDNLEAAVIRIVQALLWPVSSLLRITRIGALFSLLFHLPGLMALWLSRGVMALARALRVEGAVSWLGGALATLLSPITGLIGFFYAWCVTRRPRELLLATPAVLMVAPFVYVAVAGAVQGDGPVAARYQQAVREAQEAGELETADMFRRKLSQLGVDNSRTEYVQALRLVQGGDLAAGYLQMKRIAPPDAPGYASAHFWIARRMLAGELTAAEEPTLSTPAARMELAERHLSHMEKLGAIGPTVSIMKAYVYSQTDREQQACELLQPHTAESITAAGMRLRLLTSLGDQVAAREQAKQLLRLVDDADAAAQELTSDDHRSRVIAATLLKDEHALEAALLDWLQAAPQDSEAQRILAQLCRRLVQQALAQDFFAWEPLVKRLCLAEKLGSPPAWVNIQLRDLVKLRGRSNACRDAWLGLLGSGDASDSLIELAGTTAAQHNEITQARKAFRRLTVDGHATAVVWNNLAWSLLQDPRPLPTEALAAVEQALEQAPGNPSFRETRGQAYVMLKDWNKAIKDLEYALNALPDSHSAHKGLAIAYDAIGDSQLASIHREHAGVRDPSLNYLGL